MTGRDKIGFEDESRPSSALRAPSPRERGEGSTLVVGGGIIGICVATYLAEAGQAVTVVDRTGICEETSSGNAAAFAFSDVMPLAQKGMLRKLPGWLMDPLGPLAIRPAYLPKLTPWLVRFLKAGADGSGERAVTAQAGMMKLAEAEWMDLMDRSGTRHMLREDGSLELYESEAEFRASLLGWQARDRFGIAYEHVAGARLAELQPGLSPRFVKGTFVPGWKTVSDPKELGKAIWAYAKSKGARFQRGEVQAVEERHAGQADFDWRVRLSDGDAVHSRQVVICAGAWSHLFASSLGDAIPLETERGYNTTLPASAFDVKRQLIFGGHGFVITPLSTGLRVGGAVEFGGLKLPPNFARSKAMLEKAEAFLPGLDPTSGHEWMGYRPSLPDSLPVIGRAKASDVYYAFGHGHLGLTQAAATGRLIRDLVLRNSPAIDLTPFDARRF